MMIGKSLKLCKTLKNLQYNLYRNFRKNRLSKKSRQKIGSQSRTKIFTRARKKQGKKITPMIDRKAFFL